MILLTLSQVPPGTLQFSTVVEPQPEKIIIVGWLVKELKVLENGSKDFSDFWSEVWGP